MDARYEAFCFTDPCFYDAPWARQDGDDQLFDIARRPPPPGWLHGRLGGWLALRPSRAELPLQGWKVHVSACPDNAEYVLARVWEHCVGKGIAFKFLLGPQLLLVRTSKYAPRAASGKLVTIYPRDERELQQVCEALDAALAGQPAAYILSDLRWGAGPVHVRYGGFAERLCPGPGGDPVAAIERPDGTLVPDPREPVFTPPDWVELPACLAPHLAARSGSATDALPYRVTAALHFSNGGGVYLAQRRGPPGSAPVVLKEARPHAGLDRHGTDAVRRLGREADALARLAGIEGVPRLLERFTAGEHHFLAMDHVRGATLSRWTARNHPLNRCEGGPREFADYTRRATALLERIEQLVSRIHARGLGYGDLHPRNVIIGDGDRVSLVDYELAFPLEQPVRPGLGAAGFTPPDGRTGADVDNYGLAALRLFLFLPLGAVLALEPAKLHQYVADIEERFELPPGFTDPLLTELATATARPAAGAPRPSAAAGCLAGIRRDWAGARDSLVAGILAAATPARTDRLFPGDIEQFSSGGLGLAYGAAGVLHALDAAGAGRFSYHEQWLVDAVTAAPPRRHGLYDGAAGVSWLLQRFGYPAAADALLARLLDALPAVCAVRDTSLFGGLAGIGTALLELAALRGDPALAGHAVTLGHRLAAELDRASQRRRPGLMHGWSGPAVLFLALHRASGDSSWIDRAEQAVARDLQGCVPTRDGALQVDDGGRTLPYLDVGSAGIAVALAQLGAVRPQAPAVAALSELVRACETELVIQPGLLAGRAGLMAALVTVRDTVPGMLDERRIGQALNRHADRLDWHAVGYRGHLAFPGNGLLRLSMDLATGGAGVLLAASAALHECPASALLPGAISTATAPHPTAPHPTAPPSAALAAAGP